MVCGFVGACLIVEAADRIDVDEFGESDEKGDLGWHDGARFGLGFGSLGTVSGVCNARRAGELGAFVRVSDQSRIDISAVILWLVTLNIPNPSFPHDQAVRVRCR